MDADRNEIFVVGDDQGEGFMDPVDHFYDPPVLETPHFYDPHYFERHQGLSQAQKIEKRARRKRNKMSMRW